MSDVEANVRHFVRAVKAGQSALAADNTTVKRGEPTYTKNGVALIVTCRFSHSPGQPRHHAWTEHRAERSVVMLIYIHTPSAIFLISVQLSPNNAQSNQMHHQKHIKHPSLTLHLPLPIHITQRIPHRQKRKRHHEIRYP